MSAAVSIQELGKQVANVLADVQAHDLPSLCSRFGLPDGTKDEAFQGKFRYAHSRLLGIKAPQLLRMAHELLEEFPNPGLAEQLAKYEETGRPVVSEITRRRVIESLNDLPLEGRLGNLLELLDPVYPTASLPPAYPHWDPSKRKSLRDDIEQYCIRNYDWTNAEVLQHLGMLTCSQKRFFAYLERFVDPVVRDEDEQVELVGRLNKLLERDGYALQESGRISGYPVYAVRPLTAKGGTPADQELSRSFQRFDEAGIHELWEKALRRRMEDPEGAITIARTLVERTCKHILDERQVRYPDDADLQKLWALCAEQLNLAPNQHTEQVFRAILGNCQSVVNYLGTIRNRLGDSHGQGGKPVRPRPRHAQLVVNLAGSMATFLITTWLEQEAANTAEAPKAEASRIHKPS